MPRRTPVDQAAILVSYEETKNASETARRCGVHYNTVTAALKRNRQQCLCCANHALPARKYCPDCLTRIRDSAKRRRQERRHLGLCTLCNEPRFGTSIFCAAHRLADLEAGARYKQRKRGSPEQGIPTETRRLRSLRYNYGSGGEAAWKRDGGACVICHTPHAEKTIHLHHVDRDPTHNDVQNLACLCFNCHKLVHGITEHPQLPSVLAWIASRYPRVDRLYLLTQEALLGLAQSMTAVM